MSEEEKEAIEHIKYLIEFTEDVCLYSTDNKSYKIVLNLIDKLQKETKEGYHKGFIDGITSSKYIIGNKKEELEVQLEILLNDNSGLFTDTTIMLDQEINLLEELLEMIK